MKYEVRLYAGKRSVANQRKRGEKSGLNILTGTRDVIA